MPTVSVLERISAAHAESSTTARALGDEITPWVVRETVGPKAPPPSGSTERESAPCYTARHRGSRGPAGAALSGSANVGGEDGFQAGGALASVQAH